MEVWNCMNCNYSLKALRKGRVERIRCPECGMLHNPYAEMPESSWPKCLTGAGISQVPMLVCILIWGDGENHLLQVGGFVLISVCMMVVSAAMLTFSAFLVRAYTGDDRSFRRTLLTGIIAAGVIEIGLAVKITMVSGW